MVNQAIREFGQFNYGVYTIPGQHDLPHHNYEDIKKSSYWTLVEAGSVTHMNSSQVIPKDYYGIVLYPFPWGRKIEPNKFKKHSDQIHHIAVCHKYIWATGHSYPGAPAEAHLRKYAKCLEGYDLAVFGDNHKGFYKKIGNKPVVNCGGFSCRKSDERDYIPSYAVLYSDRSVDYIPLGVEVKWVDEVVKLSGEVNGDIEDLMTLLQGLGEQSLDFREAMSRYLEQIKVSKFVREIILSAME